MELNRSDLLRLLSILEGELQAREVVIAVLKAEQIKKLLYPNRSSKQAFSSDTIKWTPSGDHKTQHSDPWNALSRDAFGAYDPSFDRTATLALFNMKMTQLDALIGQQRRSRALLQEQLSVIECKHNAMAAELEAERHLRLQTTPLDRRLESDVKTVSQSLENERSREKQIVLCLLSERKQLIIKLIEERQRNEELLQLLSSEKAKTAEMVEGLEDESKRSLQMEAELEKYLTDFEGERQKFRTQLAASETRNAELAAEVDRLRQQLNGKSALGEGVRSAIVTMASATRCVATVPSVSSVSQPKASVAQHVVDAQHSYATISSVKMNATIPPPPSAPAPPPKALVSNSKATPTATTPPVNAFQNITYNLETNSKTTGAVRKLSAGGAGRGTPPPIPPNKPLIKPVLPPQVQRSKDSKVMAGVAKTPTNNVKNATIGANESTGEQKDEKNDLLCQELENFNSLLVSMVSNHINII
ncbi:unnamed protein product [Medioppia subpectinata]|uniref:Cortactin-binding protein-2 N-terminal domain-containing protein n=1 Tax=Medioppia subpectinata TaxID=1979941 RepID=A0A7R9L8W5_9ACAR|nr:unnamed protein product [Medioppia subpectinata]CAG2116383.1 unnamed protein product [Medioppia subpectinata]